MAQKPPGSSTGGRPRGSFARSMQRTENEEIRVQLNISIPLWFRSHVDRIVLDERMSRPEIVMQAVLDAWPMDDR